MNISLNLLFVRFKKVYFKRTIHDVSLHDIPKITSTDIRKLLRQKGVAVQDGFTSLITKCVICSGDQLNNDKKLYVNKVTGYFLCPKCNVYGDWNILEKIVKKTRIDTVTKDYIEQCTEKYKEFQKDWQKVFDATVPLLKLTEAELLDLFRLFEFPIQLEASKTLSDVRVSPEHTILYFPLKNSLQEVVGYREIHAGDEDNAKCHGLHSAGLFSCRVPKLARSDQAILVPSIQDLLHLAAHKVPGTLIWLHSCSLPPILLPSLENYSKLCLWGDWNNMRSVAEKLGDERCRFVRPTDGLVTASEAATGNLSLKMLVSEAKPAAHRSITTFAALRDDVYAELTNIDKVRGIKWRRYPALTRLLGGHRRGELTVLTGPTGCGKTTLCAEMSLDLAQQGVTTLWGSFEIRNSRLARTMLQQFAGVPLEQNLQDFPHYADEFQKLPIYYLAFHGQQPIKVVMDAVEHARYMHDIAHVVVDNVQFMLGLSEDRDDRFMRQDAVIAAFRTFATSRHCHVTLVMHPRKERESEDLSTSSIFGSAKASQEADNVLIIQDKRLTAVRGKKYLQVAKNRYSGDLGIVPLDFDKNSLSYQPKKKTKSKTDEPDKLLNQCIEDFTVDDQHMLVDNNDILSRDQNKKIQNKKEADSYLRDILNLDKTR